MDFRVLFSSTIGLLGAIVTTVLGGWSTGMATLVIFMAVDYVSGLIVAGVFKKSKKSESGALESRTGFKGLCRKCMTLLFVMVAYRLDLLIGTNYIRDAVIIGFSVNELLSIIENAGLMGLPLPSIIVKAVGILKQKADLTNEGQNYE
jgi:toxin secretion/phage lysis holin